MSSEYFLKLDRAFNVISSVLKGNLKILQIDLESSLTCYFLRYVYRLSANQALNCITVGFHGKGFYTDTNEEKRDNQHRRNFCLSSLKASGIHL